MTTPQNKCQTPDYLECIEAHPLTSPLLCPHQFAYFKCIEKLAEDMAEGLAWALKWGNFDVSEDNPLHSGAHIKALRALTAYQQATTGR